MNATTCFAEVKGGFIHQHLQSILRSQDKIFKQSRNYGVLFYFANYFTEQNNSLKNNTVSYSHKISENWQVFSYIHIKSQVTKKPGVVTQMSAS